MALFYIPSLSRFISLPPRPLMIQGDPKMYGRMITLLHSFSRSHRNVPSQGLVRPISGFFFLLGLILVCETGCTYRFTNTRLTLPKGVRTIAIEAVYDTSREVLPHEILWESLQTAFASDGHLRLTSQSQADALVRAHLKQASIVATGTEQLNGPRKEPNPYTSSTPPPLSEYPTLSQASRYKDTAHLRTVVEVEIWDLRTRNVLLRQTYALGENFRAVHQTKNGEFTTAANDFLRYDEAATAKFQNISRTIAQSVVRDLLFK